MYGIYTNIGGVLMVNVTIYGIHGSYGIKIPDMKHHETPVFHMDLYPPSNLTSHVFRQGLHHGAQRCSV